MSSHSSVSNLKGNPEILIKEVHKRRPIWDLKSPAHHNREIVQKLWNEISKKLGAPLDAIKNKWKHLRDNFRTELKKTVRGSGNPPQPYQSQWMFFNDLLFLEEQMMKKINRLYGPFPYKVNVNADDYDEFNCEDGTNNETDNQNDSGNYLTHSHSVFDDNSTHDQEPISWWLQDDLISASNSLINCNNNNNNLDENTKNKRRRYDNDINSYNTKLNHQLNADIITNDDDYHFMMSLLPFIKSLPMSRKMYIRLKIQELVCNFVYKLDPNSNNVSDSTNVLQSNCDNKNSNESEYKDKT